MGSPPSVTYILAFQSFRNAPFTPNLISTFLFQRHMSYLYKDLKWEVVARLSDIDRIIDHHSVYIFFITHILPLDYGIKSIWKNKIVSWFDFPLWYWWRSKVSSQRDVHAVNRGYPSIEPWVCKGIIRKATFYVYTLKISLKTSIGY